MAKETSKKVAPAKEESNVEEKLDTKKLNIYQKIAMIRLDFAKAGAKKSGKNTHAEFLYYELDDIIPICNELIIEKYNCLFLTDFKDGKATGTLINLDNPTETYQFGKDMKDIAEAGKYRMNEIQADGSQITYYRRYLYFILLDICTPDDIDANSGTKDKNADEPVAKTTKAKKPATVEERAEIKEKIVDAEGQADELQITGLKNALKRLKELDPSQEAMIKKIATKTKKFTVISKDSCEKLVLKISDMISALEGEEDK